MRTVNTVCITIYGNMADIYDFNENITIHYEGDNIYGKISGIDYNINN